MSDPDMQSYLRALERRVAELEDRHDRMDYALGVHFMRTRPSWVTRKRIEGTSTTLDHPHKPETP